MHQSLVLYVNKTLDVEEVVICPHPSEPGGQERTILSQMKTFSTGCTVKGDFEKCNLTSQ